jgi:hypothetical protein
MSQAARAPKHSCFKVQVLPDFLRAFVLELDEVIDAISDAQELTWTSR